MPAVRLVYSGTAASSTAAAIWSATCDESLASKSCPPLPAARGPNDASGPSPTATGKIVAGSSARAASRTPLCVNPVTGSGSFAGASPMRITALRGMGRHDRSSKAVISPE